MTTFTDRLAATGLCAHVRVLPGVDELGREYIDVVTYVNGYLARNQSVRLYKTPDGWDKAEIYLNLRYSRTPHLDDFDLDFESVDPVRP